jgi:TatA/E family protein of Tat protein translocase
MVVLVLALLVFGPAKLPELLGSLGHAIREFQRASRELTEVFQETQQEFQSALDLDAQYQPQTTSDETTYEVPAEVPVAPAEVPATAHPEEFETAAAMIDPVEPFQPPAEPEPEPVVAVAEPPLGVERARPKRIRRKKAEELAGEPAVIEEAIAAEPPTAEQPIATEPPTAELPIAAEVTTTVTAGISAATPVEAPIEPAPANGVESHENGAVPKPRRRRAAVAAASTPADESV